MFVKDVSVCMMDATFFVVEAEAMVDGIFHMNFLESIDVHVEDKDGAVVGFVSAVVHSRSFVWEHGVVVPDHSVVCVWCVSCVCLL